MNTFKILPIVILILFMLAGCGEDKPLSTYAPQVQTYYDEVLALATEADGAAKDFALIAQDLAEGQGDVYVAYEAASNAMKISNAANILITQVKIPDMPGDLEDMLENGSSELSTCYYVRGNAYESVMNFLDTESPAALQEYKDGLKQAEGFMLRGMAKLIEAKVATGIIKANE